MAQLFQIQLIANKKILTSRVNLWLMYVANIFLLGIYLGFNVKE